MPLAYFPFILYTSFKRWTHIVDKHILTVTWRQPDWNGCFYNKDTAPTMTKSSNMKRAEDDKPKGVDMAQSLWLDTIVHENQKYYGLIELESRQCSNYNSLISFYFGKWIQTYGGIGQDHLVMEPAGI